MLKPSLSNTLLTFAITHPTDALTQEHLRWAALRAVDTIGSALAAAVAGEGVAASIMVSRDATGEGGAASIWGAGPIRASAADAALANGMLSHGIEYDDTHTSATLHPGSVVVPAVLAIAEQEGSSGKDVLAAILVGYEVAARLGRLRPGRFQSQGFHPSSVLGIFGALAGVARLLHLTPEVATHAAGLAGSMASGLMEYLSDASNTKQMHPGWAAHGAIVAAKLAAVGATGPSKVLEGERGIFAAHLPQGDPLKDFSQATEGLGEEWVGLLVATKPYPACHSNHAPVDCWTTIRDREGLTAADVPHIRRITGIVPHWYLQLVCEPLEHKRAPRSVYEARFSLPYSVARVVVDGQITLDSYSPDALRDPAVLEIASRIDYEVHDYPTFPEAFPGGLRVEMADGRIFEEHMPHNAGSVANPLTELQIQEKLLQTAGLVGDEAAVERLNQAILDMAVGSVDAPQLSEAFSGIAASKIVSN